MNVAVYNRIHTPREEPKAGSIESPAILRASIQQQSDWIRSQRTQEIFEELGREIESLETQARILAVQYPQHQNPHGIVQRLVRAEELRNLIKTYGRVKTDSTTTQKRDGADQS